MTGDPVTRSAPALDSQTLAAVREDAAAVLAQLRRVYQGPEHVAELLLTCLVAGGHLLLEGVPGVAKTTLVKAFAETLDASFRRVQFTPDLLPGDITGIRILDRSTNTFVLRPGPVFAHVVLGDEINRAPAKTQSALLEAMQEGQVTIDGETRRLPEPFIVLATQNPVEQEGVYLLPEAQLDRFLMKLTMGYPSADQEAEMLARHGHGRPSIATTLSTDRILEMRALAEGVAVSDTIRHYVVGLARATRDHASAHLGASPRASLALMRASRARAMLQGRDYVHVDDVRRLVEPVFAHRIVLTSSAVISGVTEDRVIRDVVSSVAWDPA